MFYDFWDTGYTYTQTDGRNAERMVLKQDLAPLGQGSIIEKEVRVKVYE